jgi:surfactin synthase thioesterase subunit
MGAALALKITAMMEAENRPPARLIVSGNAGPGVSTGIDRHTLPSEDFKNELRRLGGMPEEVLSDKELFSFFEPIIRADFEIAHKNDLISLAPVKTDIYAVMGREEELAGKIDNWGKFTSGKFSKEILSGGHFFINNHAKRIADIICENYSYV